MFPPRWLSLLYAVELSCQTLEEQITRYFHDIGDPPEETLGETGRERQRHPACCLTYPCRRTPEIDGGHKCMARPVIVRNLSETCLVSSDPCYMCPG